MDTPKSGQLLIAEPFLNDPNFKRAVVLLCQHDSQGSFGLLLNKQLKLTIKDVFTHLYNCTIPIFFGGPVQMNTLHIIHLLPNLIPNSKQITNNIYWGGDVDVIIDLIETNKIDFSKIRFYLGYCGWEQRQLANEMNVENSWITVEAKANFVFHNNIQHLWADAVTLKGGEYKQWKIFLIDPQLN